MKNSLKILHIATQDFGGAGMSAVRLAVPMNKFDIDSKLLCLVKKNSSQYIYKYYPSKKEAICNILIRIKNRFLRKYKKINLFGSFSFLRSGFDQKKSPLFKGADIIQLHSVGSFIDYKLFFRDNNKKIIWTLHDMAPFSNGYHYELWDSGTADSFLKKKIKIMKNVDNLVIVSPSQWLLRKSKESETFRKFDHYCIPYGLDENIFKPCFDSGFKKDLKIDESKKIILFVADQVDDKRKGIQFLFDVLERIQREGKNFFVVTVGSNTADFDKYKDFMYHFGRVDDEILLAKIYSIADLFIIPSIEDNLPNTMIESIMCGTPVVGFNIGGIPDVVKSGENGFLCEDISSDNLYLNIVKALGYDFDREKIAQEAHKNFSQKVSIGRYKDLYKKILSL